MELSPGSLKWPAIYGLTNALAVVVLGSSIGRWVDRTPRWHGIKIKKYKSYSVFQKILFFPSAGRISLAVQNILVVACAVCVGLTFYYRGILVNDGKKYN